MHGYLCNGKTFINQTEFFRRDFNVFAPDLKGFGENADMPYPYSLDDYINEVKEYMCKNSITHPHVIAHSFGARIVIKSASQNADLFDKIVLTGPAGLKPPFSIKKAFRKRLFKTLKPILGAKRLEGFYSSDYKSLSSVQKLSFIKIVNEHLDYCLKDVTNDLLVICGENDKDTPPSYGKRICQNAQNGKLSIYKNSGHFCFLDCPLKFNLEVREFLLS